MKPGFQLLASQIAQGADESDHQVLDGAALFLGEKYAVIIHCRGRQHADYISSTKLVHFREKRGYAWKSAHSHLGKKYSVQQIC